jgi:ATP-dependent exoDNAse (exonuclease V) alpha subunit
MNKSQGQSLSTVGIDLRKPVFTHGQLYVSMSRSIHLKGIIVLFNDDNEERRSENVVYPELLN